MLLENYIIEVFCLVDDMLKNLTKMKKLRQRGFKPRLLDSEMITMEIVAEFVGIDTDKGAWEYFRNHWLDLFPHLGSRSNYAKHASNLWQIKQELQQKLAINVGGFSDNLHMADGFPMPTAHFKRARRSKCFSGEAAYGYCASKDETYYGFKGNLLINSEGVITALTVTPANIDERESLWDILTGIKGMVIADKGLISEDLQKKLRTELEINLQTPLRDNMKDPRPKGFRKWLVSTRRLVETVIGQLADRFNIEKVRARKLWHMTNRVTRKVLAHTVAVFLNKKEGNRPLQFEHLISA
jgi:hypothetical protein